MRGGNDVGNEVGLNAGCMCVDGDGGERMRWDAVGEATVVTCDGCVEAANFCMREETLGPSKHDACIRFQHNCMHHTCSNTQVDGIR